MNSSVVSSIVVLSQKDNIFVFHMQRGKRPLGVFFCAFDGKITEFW